MRPRRRPTVADLVGDGRLEAVTPDPAEARDLLAHATAHLESADLRTVVVDCEGSSAVFVFAFFVPAVGLAAGPFGVPVQVVRIGVAPGSVSAPGIDVAARYTVGRPDELGERTTALSTHPSAHWLKNGRLRDLAGGYHGVTRRRAELAGEASFGPAARLGLDPNRPDGALYADRAELRASLPAEHA